MTWAAIVVGGVVAVGGTVGSLVMANQNRPDAPDQTYSAKTGTLLKEQYEDWKKNFQPIELGLLKQVSSNNQSILPSALSESKETVGDVYDSMAGVLERRNSSLGIAETPQQKATSRRLLNLSEASSMVSAENQTRNNVRSMDEQILNGTIRRG